MPADPQFQQSLQPISHQPPWWACGTHCQSPSSSGGQNKPMKLRRDRETCLGDHEVLSCVIGIRDSPQYFQRVSLCSSY